jgi:hypothetical protein
VSSESVYQVARSGVDVGSFDTRLVVRFMIFTESVRNILDTSSYMGLLDKAVTKCTHQRIGAVLHYRYRQPVASTCGTQRDNAHLPTVTKMIALYNGTGKKIKLSLFTS